MRINFTKTGVLRLARTVAVVSVGAAAGCSSDVLRFSDDFYASAVPQRPATSQNDAYGQPSYDPNIVTGSIAPAGVTAFPPQPQGADIAAPHPTAGVGATTAPLPARINPAPATDSISTGSVTRTPVAAPVMTRGGWTAKGARKVTIRDGETIAVLSKRYGVPERAILEVNGISNAKSVRSGQRVLIPVFSRERLTGSAPQTAAPALQPQPEASQRAAVTAAGGHYTVVSGDTLSSISRRTGASVASIKLTNDLATDAIRVGQKLIIPGLAAEGATKTARLPNVDPVVTGGVERRPGTQVAATEARPAPKSKSAPAAPAAEKTARAPETTGVSAMRWPVQGRVVSAFQSNTNGKPNDGIDISVPAGTPVKAAENGVVIYAGDGPIERVRGERELRGVADCPKRDG